MERSSPTCVPSTIGEVPVAAKIEVTDGSSGSDIARAIRAGETRIRAQVPAATTIYQTTREHHAPA
ncbi:hypothetical protein D9M69_667060 [compost metagenome]